MTVQKGSRCWRPMVEKIEDYEGLNNLKTQLVLTGINTTAASISEMNSFYHHHRRNTSCVKMAIVDDHVTPFLSETNSDLMEGMPASLTAATGMMRNLHARSAVCSHSCNPTH